MTISANITEVVEETAKVIKSVTTGYSSPENVLDTLEKLGIESFVTENGDLMIKYWQIAAENFCSTEQAAVVRIGQSSPNKGDMLDWLSKNLDNVRNNYGGQWIAVHNESIIASSAELSELMNNIQGYDNPLITFIPSEPVVWNFTYAV